MDWKVWKDESGRICARFEGKLTAEAGQDSVAQFIEHLHDVPAAVVFDITAMDGYESGARSAWQQGLWPHRKKISSITMVGGNAITRMGGQILGLALGVAVASVKTWEEL